MGPNQGVSVVPWEVIGRAEVPSQSKRPGQGMEISAGDELILYRRGEEFAIRVDNRELMNSRSFASEQTVAVAACSRLKATPAPRVLVAGLGLGFTLRTALDHLSEASHVVVAELIPGVVEWNREHVGHLADHPLRDPRVEVHLGDAAEYIRSCSATHGPGVLDAIILDVDNGPHTKPSPSEGWLYSPAGLEACHRAVTPTGVLTIWSAGPTVGFSKRVAAAGFVVEEVRCRGHGGRGAQHRVWVAQPEGAVPH